MIINGDCLPQLRLLEEGSVDLIVTDPPYGYSFMGKDWDKAVPSVEIWKECLRVLKPGGFAFIMSAPRSDVLSRMIVRIEDAGFRVDFSPIYWTYASGFPKAMNIGKMVDKRGGKDWHEQKQVALYIRERMKEIGTTAKALNAGFNTIAKANHWTALDANNFCMPTLEDYTKLKPLLGLDDRFDDLIEREEAEREVIGKASHKSGIANKNEGHYTVGGTVALAQDITAPATPQAKALDGSYGGFQPKPAVEVVIVAMKPLSEKTYVDQALANGKGITWLDDCRIPTTDEIRETTNQNIRNNAYTSDNSDRERDTTYVPNTAGRFPANLLVEDEILGDYSRFFSLGKWAENLPFLAVPKASKREKNEGLGEFEDKATRRYGERGQGSLPQQTPQADIITKNHHPTVKPLTLMSYLITLGSREGDTVLDPFVGSGTTAVAAIKLNRKCIGIEREQEYVDIALARVRNVQPPLAA